MQKKNPSSPASPAIPAKGTARRVVALLVGVLLASLGASAEAPLGCPDDFEVRVVELVNQERAGAELEPLEIDVRLMESAFLHSDDMAQTPFFGHTGSNGSTMAQRIVAAGYTPWNQLAENVAAGYTTPESVVAAWMDSPGHRANILHPDLEDIGVGYVYLPGTPYWHYWTQNFGRSSTALESPRDFCPACSDTLDNDLDGATDHPDDPNCSDGSDASEAAMRCGLGFELAALLSLLALLRPLRNRAGDLPRPRI